MLIKNLPANTTKLGGCCSRDNCYIPQDIINWFRNNNQFHIFNITFRNECAMILKTLAIRCPTIPPFT